MPSAATIALLVNPNNPRMKALLKTGGLPRFVLACNLKSCK
jgi:hypothetical protein